MASVGLKVPRLAQKLQAPPVIPTSRSNWGAEAVALLWDPNGYGPNHLFLMPSLGLVTPEGGVVEIDGPRNATLPADVGRATQAWASGICPRNVDFFFRLNVEDNNLVRSLEINQGPQPPPDRLETLLSEF